ECGLSGGAEYYRFTGADRRVGAQGPGRALAVGQPEGLPAPLDHRGVALAIRADAIDPGRRIETQRLHLRTRQGHLEGAHLRVEAVEDLDLTVGVPHDAGAVGGGVADIALGLALVGQSSGFEALGGRQTVDDPQVRLLLGMMRE